MPASFRTRRLPLSIAIISLLQGVSVLADHNHDPQQMEEVNVYDRSRPDTHSLSADVEFRGVDSGEMLKSLPGVDINSNGPVTGIFQYRGMFGDRVPVSIDQSPAPAGGPNSMDSPLSYVSPLMVKDIHVVRGIAPVSMGQETIGGHANANLDRGEFGNNKDFQLNGKLSARYDDNHEGQSYGLRATVANRNHKLNLTASFDEGNDFEAADNTRVGGTEYQRERFDLSYGFQQDKNQLEVFAGQLETENSGTPALPMDITVIETDMAGIQLSTEMNDIKLAAKLGYGDVYHVMDNFSLRAAPANPMMYRLTEAEGDHISWSFTASSAIEAGKLTVGLDGIEASHDADIFNPNNAAFLIENFNDVERNVHGIFAELENKHQQRTSTIGLRFNRVEMDSGEVSFSGLPMMMNMGAMTLANAFNNSDRSNSYDLYDLVINSQWQLDKNQSLSLGLGRKNRAPSYQERYLWLPLPATGGLADGRNYIGNSDLQEETSNEITLGYQWQTQSFSVSPAVYYRAIDDYIQGVPANNMVANMIGTMMSGKAALQFDNIDAEIYGVDIEWHYMLSASWELSGNLSYTRGKRKDASDDLYRIAPLNHRLALAWHNQSTRIVAESVLYASQDDVSAFNDEEETAGYGIVNLRAEHQLKNDLMLYLAANNVLDQNSPNHLGGYNRNADSDIAVGDRIPGPGRSLQAGVSWEF